MDILQFLHEVLCNASHNPTVTIKVSSHYDKLGHAVSSASDSWARAPGFYTFVSPSADFKKGHCQLLAKVCARNTGKPHLGGLNLPRKSVFGLTDCPNMTINVYHGSKATTQEQHILTMPVLWASTSLGQLYCQVTALVLDFMLWKVYILCRSWAESCPAETNGWQVESWWTWRQILTFVRRKHYPEETCKKAGGEN